MFKDVRGDRKINIDVKLTFSHKHYHIYQCRSRHNLIFYQLVFVRAGCQPGGPEEGPTGGPGGHRGQGGGRMVRASHNVPIKFTVHVSIVTNTRR